MLDPIDLPRSEPDDRPPDLERERDLRQCPVAAADGHERVGRTDDGPLRVSPRPVAIAISTQPLALAVLAREDADRAPSRERAPRLTASITPPMPPVTTTQPASASAAPISSAASSVAGAPRPDRDGDRGAVGVGGGHCSADDDVDELARHHDHLHDVVTVDVGVDVRRGQRELLELLARGARRRGDAVAQRPLTWQTSW